MTPIKIFMPGTFGVIGCIAVGLSGLACAHERIVFEYLSGERGEVSYDSRAGNGVVLDSTFRAPPSRARVEMLLERMMKGGSVTGIRDDWYIGLDQQGVICTSGEPSARRPSRVKDYDEEWAYPHVIIYFKQGRLQEVALTHRGVQPEALIQTRYIIRK